MEQWNSQWQVENSKANDSFISFSLITRSTAIIVIVNAARERWFIHIPLPIHSFCSYFLFYWMNFCWVALDERDRTIVTLERQRSNDLNVLNLCKMNISRSVQIKSSSRLVDRCVCDPLLCAVIILRLSVLCVNEVLKSAFNVIYLWRVFRLCVCDLEKGDPPNVIHTSTISTEKLLKFKINSKSAQVPFKRIRIEFPRNAKSIKFGLFNKRDR